MTRLHSILKCILLASAAAALLAVAFLALSLRTAAKSLATATYNASMATWHLAASADNVAALTGQLRDSDRGVMPSVNAFLVSTQAGLFRLTDKQLSGVRRDALAVVERADARVGELLPRVDAALSTVESLRKDAEPVLVRSASLVSHADEALQDGRTAAAEIRAEVQPVAVNAGAFVRSARVVADQAADAAPMFLDCRYNPNCLFNRYQGASKSFERTMASVAKTADHIQHITQPRWYDRLLGYGLNGVVIWRSLNPATNFVTSTVQAVSAQK